MRTAGKNLECGDLSPRWPLWRLVTKAGPRPAARESWTRCHIRRRQVACRKRGQVRALQSGCGSAALCFLCLFAANPTCERLPLLKFSAPVVDELSRMQATSPVNKSKSSLGLLLLLGAVVCWASLETYRLWVATQQVASSQQLEMRVAAKLEAARAKNAHFAKADAATPSTGAAQK